MKSAWECFRLAAKCEAKALGTVNPGGRAALLKAARQWRDLGNTAQQARGVVKGTGTVDGHAALAGQKAAFEAALGGRPLDTSLKILLRTAIEQADGETRGAFYVTNPAGTSLHHVTGMSERYAQCVDGFAVAPSSLACGLAAHLRQPVITPDVSEEPLWKPWLWLAEQFGYRACWSFPVETADGKVVGTFAVYSEKPRYASPYDLEFAAAITQAAGVIIHHHAVVLPTVRAARRSQFDGVR